ncbi:MAG TPA: glycosyltransferase [Pyrinomonadaceae bacterium]|nr:glycosyltransferase [Pyrinomonadaceae bacterium]
MSLHGKRVLFISYNGMLDPLGQTQVLPYLQQLAAVGIDFTLLSFERALAYTDEGRERCRRLHDELKQHRIDWHWLPYHKTPSLPATAYDVFAGYRLARRLVCQKQIELVHARSHIPATIALRLKRRLGTKMIFDVRGLLADEYVDAHHWRKDSVPYRLTKNAERRALTAADGVVTLTQRIWDVIKDWDSLRDRSVPHAVVPCCADLELFHFDAAARAAWRTELGIEDRFVLVYSGSIDGWYLTEEMCDFFVTLRAQKPNAFFLWLTNGNRERIKSLMTDRGVSKEDFQIISALPADVPSYLSAADAGLAFIKNCFSKQASSPTKYAEYLGCGLPLVINAGIGDSDALIDDEKVGVLVRRFDQEEYTRAAAAIGVMTNDVEQTRARTREVAERLLDVRRVGRERYVALYEQVLAS